MPVLENLKKNLAIEYKIKHLGEVKTIIRWQITRNLSTKTIKVSQLVYIRDLLKEENLTNYNVLTILIKAGSFIKINKSDNYNKANLGDYHWLIGKFIYLAYRIRPNIVFVVGKLSKYNTNPRKGHLQAAKRLICYFKYTIHLELIYK